MSKKNQVRIVVTGDTKQLKRATDQAEREIRGFGVEFDRVAGQLKLDASTLYSERGQFEVTGEKLAKALEAGLGSGAQRAMIEVKRELAPSTLYADRAGFEKAGRLLGEEIGDGLEKGADGAVDDARRKLDPDGLRALSGDYQMAGRRLGDSAADGVEDGIARGEGPVGDAMGGLVDSLPAGLVSPAGAAGAVVGGALVAGLMTGFEQNLEKERIGDFIAARMGVESSEINERSDTYGRIAGELYADAFGGSVEEVGLALGEIEARLSGDGLSDTQLKNLAETALTFAEVMGVDVNESIEAAGNLMRNGLARDGVHAYDLLTASAQGLSATQKDEVLAATEEYSTFFAALGFDGERAMGIVAQAAQGGRYEIDKTGDAIKEFGIINREMGEDVALTYETMGLDWVEMHQAFSAGGAEAEAAFDKVIAGLLGIENPAQRSAAAVTLFGTPMEDLAADSDQLDQVLQNMASGGMTDVEGKSADLSAAYDNMSTDWESTKRKLQANMGEIVGNYQMGVGYIANDKVRDKVHQGMSFGWGATTAMVKGRVREIAGSYAIGMSNMNTTARVAGNQLLGQMGRTWGGIQIGVGVAAGVVAGKAGEIATSIRNIPSRIGDMSRALYNAGRDLIQGLINGVGSMVGALGRKVADVAGGAVDAAKRIFGIKSPSVVFARIGRQAMEGLELGIADQGPAATAEVARIAQRMIDAGTFTVPGPSIAAAAQSAQESRRRSEALLATSPRIAAEDSLSGAMAQPVVINVDLRGALITPDTDAAILAAVERAVSKGHQVPRLKRAVA